MGIIGVPASSRLLKAKGNLVARLWGNRVLIGHVNDWADLNGELNNLEGVSADLATGLPTTDWKYPLNWNLMREPAVRTDRNGQWLTDDQVNRGRLRTMPDLSRLANPLNHPAFAFTD
jgi:hypothetical protein